MNLVIVSHGLTLRVFLMRWYKWTVKQFEGLHNFGNAKMIVLERGYGGRYLPKKKDKTKQKSCKCFLVIAFVMEEILLLFETI